MTRPPPSHPGEILRDALDRRKITPYALAKAMGVTPSRVHHVLDGSRGITADTALRLARVLGTTPEVWMTLQARYDIGRSSVDLARELAALTPFPEAA